MRITYCTVTVQSSLHYSYSLVNTGFTTEICFIMNTAVPCRKTCHKSSCFALYTLIKQICIS